MDCADLERISESRTELESLLRDEQVCLVLTNSCYVDDDVKVAAAPVVVLGNKIDKPNALSEDQLKWHLGIQHMCTGKG